MSKEISPLIVGGQGTYLDGHYYTEYPDRDLAIQHCEATRKVVADNIFNYVVASGGCTQGQTPGVSEAQSFLNMWTETQTKPNVPVVLDEVALDSAENVIFGLMALRLEEPTATIRRIGFYSLWQFKKQRMTSLAKVLGIESQFYFYAFALPELANAGRLSQEGEEKQLALMAATQDYVLRGKLWDEKRRKRNKVGTYEERDAHLRARFKETFSALDGLEKITIHEVQAFASDDGSRDINEVLDDIREQKAKRLQDAFRREVLQPGTAEIGNQ